MLSQSAITAQLNIFSPPVAVTQLYFYRLKQEKVGSDENIVHI